MSEENNKHAAIGVRLKRLVSRLAYCAKHDAIWYFTRPSGVREDMTKLVDALGSLACAAVVLVLNPAFRPLTWIWHSARNGAHVDAIMERNKSKTANDKDERRASEN